MGTQEIVTPLEKNSVSILESCSRLHNVYSDLHVLQHKFFEKEGIPQPFQKFKLKDRVRSSSIP